MKRERPPEPRAGEVVEHEDLVREHEDLLRQHAELAAVEAELRARLDAMAARVEGLVAQGLRYRSFFEDAEQPRVITDALGVIREANAAARDFLALAPRFLAGKPLAVFVDRNDVARFRAALARALEGPVLLQLGMHGRRRPSRPVELRGSRLQDGRHVLWQLRTEDPLRWR